MKNSFYILVFATLLSGIAGCKKEENKTLEIYGLWEVTQSLPGNISFVRFNTDKSVTVYTSSTKGFRDEFKNNCTVSEDQVQGEFVKSRGTVILNYTIEGNVLTMRSADNQIFIAAQKTTSGLPDSWTQTVTPATVFSNIFSENRSGIGYDGTNLLFVEYNPGIVYRVSKVTGAVISQFNTTPGSLNTIEYDGTNYWIGSNGSQDIEKIDGTGATLLNSVNMGSWILGIAYLNTSLIVTYSNNEHTLYKYNPTTNLVEATSIDEDMWLGDAAAYNNKVYIINSKSPVVYRLNPADFSVEKTYTIEGATELNGIASTGSGEFWINANEGGKLLKVMLD